jgi:hypothetical protein
MPSENGKTLKDYSPSKTDAADSPRIASQVQSLPAQANQPLIQSAPHQTLPPSGSPIKLICWKDGVIGTITFTSTSGFVPLEA